MSVAGNSEVLVKRVLICRGGCDQSIFKHSLCAERRVKVKALTLQEPFAVHQQAVLGSQLESYCNISDF